MKYFNFIITNHFGGLMNVINRQDFGAGFAAGAMASLVGSALGEVKGLRTTNAAGKSIFTPIGRAAVIASGGLSGGISSTIAGGNFWDGARQGLITAGLNHAMHGMMGKGNRLPPGDDEEKVYDGGELDEVCIGGGCNNTISKANDVVNGFGIANDLKLGLLEIGSKGTQIGSSMSKYMQFYKGLGIAGSAFTTGYSTGEAIGQYNSGGLSNVFTHRDYFDATIGTIGLAAIPLTHFGLLSNPVGWGIGTGVLLYGVSTTVWDATRK
ncbi:MAG: hypothetical protein ACEQSF_01065 [Solirubrobacteraceae bacterium]